MEQEQLEQGAEVREVNASSDSARVTTAEVAKLAGVEVSSPDSGSCPNLEVVTEGDGDNEQQPQGQELTGQGGSVSNKAVVDARQYSGSSDKGSGAAMRKVDSVTSVSSGDMMFPDATFISPKSSQVEAHFWLSFRS